MHFADRITRVEPSATLAISALASELEAEGADVVDLSVGEPDFPTPENVVEAGQEAMAAGHTGYTTPAGIPELRETIAEKLRADGLDHDPDEIIVTPGAKQSLYEVIQTLVDDGDEVVLLDPAWVSYEAMVKLAGGSLVRVDLSPYDFQLEPALSDLENVISDGTDLLIVNSPSNPTGAVYSEAALSGVRDLAVEHDVTVVSDEIYGEITYGTEPTSLGSLDGMADRTTTVNGFSKAYSMTGWRLGYYAGPSELIEQAGKLHSHSVSCATNFVQHAGVEALTNTDEAVAEMVAAFRDRRDLLVDLFADEGVDLAVPDGAFYMMIPVGTEPGGSESSGDGPRVTDTEWCERALEEAHVATTPGSAFGAPGYARLSYAASEERLREGVERLIENDLL
ncbi:pyridoxal phosphate-dependent aminotransferase [Halovivax gelatinilyticus]|uniref:pyridoxal phosphate-dependent aminotransferase n=1 Tax=Halovivax gelatinilyticus TaxID=2961597 RepID=UPI0020CA2BF4|nr:pyridoxal phosphate-dependent aminotransferase [Halovivax gelatinilyticus]